MADIVRCHAMWKVKKGREMTLENRTHLVSCIMPTAGRRRFVPQAIGYFLRQDYPNRELVIVDDGTDNLADLLPDDARVRYVRLDRALPRSAPGSIATRAMAARGWPAARSATPAPAGRPARSRRSPRARIRALCGAVAPRRSSRLMITPSMSH